MRYIKKLLFRMLGHKRYLLFVSSCFIVLYRTGWLKLFKKFDTHYLAGRMVRKGDSIIDIGANVGYYTTLFARKAGKEGSVSSVEPIPLYREVLQANSRRLSNVKILPYALGDRDGTMKMGIPGGDATRHGLTRVLKSSEPGKSGPIWEVEIRKASVFFKNEPGVDYIKCDIEGYEDIVMPELYPLIKKFLPVIQIELSGGISNPVASQLKDLGYSPYQAKNKKLVPLDDGSKVVNDMIFLTEALYSRLKIF